jgi:hypothetical protein
LHQELVDLNTGNGDVLMNDGKSFSNIRQLLTDMFTATTGAQVPSVGDIARDESANLSLGSGAGDVPMTEREFPFNIRLFSTDMFPATTREHVPPAGEEAQDVTRDESANLSLGGSAGMAPATEGEFPFATR